MLDAFFKLRFFHGEESYITNHLKLILRETVNFASFAESGDSRETKFTVSIGTRSPSSALEEKELRALLF